MNIWQIATINIAKGLKYNIAEVMRVIMEQEIDAIVITESDCTSMDAMRIKNQIESKGFQIFSSDCNKRDNEAANVNIVIRKGVKIIEACAFNRGIGIKIQSTCDTIVNILGIYKGFNADINKILIEDMTKWIMTTEGATVVLGDFNERDSTERFGDDAVTSTNNTLMKKLNNEGFIDCYKRNCREVKWSRIGRTKNGVCKTRIDHIFGNEEFQEIIIETDIIHDNWFNSDHRMVYAKIHLDSQEAENIEIKQQINVRSANEDEIKRFMELTTSDIILPDGSIDLKIAEWNKSILCAGEKAFGLKDPSYNPYERALANSQTFQSARKNKKRALDEYNKGSMSKKEFKVWKKEYSREKRSVLSKVGKRIAAKTRENILKSPANLFKAVKDVGKQSKKSRESPYAVRGVDNRINILPEDVKRTFHDFWNKQWNNKGTRSKKPQWLKEIKREKEQINSLKQIVTEEEFAEAVKDLPNGKAAGEEEIFYEYIKRMGLGGMNSLIEIFNECISTNKFPRCWKNSITMMIHKDGEKTDPANYRPIALISCAYKVLSTIMNKRLIEWTTRNKIIDPNQFGFQKGKDTTTAFITLKSIIENSQTANRDLHLVLIDIAKAYDSVEHWSLLQTLETYGMSNDDRNLIKEMISGCTTKIITAHGLTEEIKIDCGVRQGDVISPTLFIIFFNPLLEMINKTDTGYKIGEESISQQAYADDLGLISETTKGCEKQFECTKKFCRFNFVKINTKKSGYLWRGDRQAIVEVDGNKVEYLHDTGFYKYLGWTINLRLDWSNQINILNRHYKGSVKKIMNNKRITTDNKITLINAIAQTVILYRTQAVKLNPKWLESLDKWTQKWLAITSKIFPTGNDGYWYIVRGLNKLNTESNFRFLTTVIDRGLNRNVLPKFAKIKLVQEVKPLLAEMGWRIQENVKEGESLDELWLKEETKNKLINAGINNRETFFKRDGNLMDLNEIASLGIKGCSEGDIKMIWRQCWTNRSRKTENREAESPVKCWENVPTEMWDNKIVAWTDGGQHGKASAAFFANDNPFNSSFRTNGKNEVNNAELQGIEYVLKTIPKNKSCRIISDSLNAIRGSTSIENSRTNTSTCIRIKNIIRQRLKMGSTTEFFHVRSHAEDTSRVDHYKRKEDNRRTFKDFQDKAEWGNQKADELTQDKMGERTKLTMEDFQMNYAIFNRDDEIIDGDVKISVKTRLREMDKERWFKFQPSFSEIFQQEEYDKDLLPKKTDKYINLLHKIMTKQCWTKCFKITRNKNVDHPLCNECGEVEDDNHVFDKCEKSIALNDQMWNKIKEVYSHHKFTPWFTTNATEDNNWTLNNKAGNRGLIPSRLRKFIDSHSELPAKEIEEKILKIREIVLDTTVKKWTEKKLSKEEEEEREERIRKRKLDYQNKIKENKRRKKTVPPANDQRPPEKRKQTQSDQPNKRTKR